MRVLVCGGRDYADKNFLFGSLDYLRSRYAITFIIHGAARGADSLAAEWAKSRGVPQIACPADWNAHGRSAGPIRNRKMLAEEHPDYVVAFPGGKGTHDMVTISTQAGKPVWDLREVQA